jgi:hypothetical protein
VHHGTDAHAIVHPVDQHFHKRSLFAVDVSCSEIEDEAHPAVE